MPEKKAKLILEVAQAIGTQLEMCELLAALNNTLKPMVHFDAVAIMILVLALAFPERLLSRKFARSG